MIDETSFDDLLPELRRVVDESAAREIELNLASDVLAQLRAQLATRIDGLLTHRRELLMSLLYRVDVKESFVMDALSDPDPDNIAQRLADLIVERQVQKVRSRRAYRDSHS